MSDYGGTIVHSDDEAVHCGNEDNEAVLCNMSTRVVSLKGEETLHALLFQVWKQK